MADSAKSQPRQPKAQEGQEKVLRIGIVQGGKVVHERLIRPGQSVSVGESPKNTFVVPAASLPKRHTLFQAKGDKYFLNFTDAMKGKISYSSGIKGLDELAKAGDASKKGNVHVLPVGGNTRGKVVFDDVTVLFQFVPPPPVSLKNLGQKDFRPKLLDEDDPVFLGFLALFTALATVIMIYVYSVEPVDMVPVDEIPDRFTEIVMSSDDDIEPPEEEDPLEVEVEEAQKVEKEEVVETTEKKPKREMSEAEKAAAEAARQEKLKEDVMQQSKLLAGILGTRGDNNSGDRVEDVFADDDAIGASLDEALKNVGGVDIASSDKLGVKKGSGGGRGDAKIGDLTKGGGGDAAVGSGPATTVRASSQLGPADGGYGEGADAVKQTVKKYGGQVKHCYDRELKVDQSLGGRLAIEFNVANGRVVGAFISENGTGSKSLEKCVLTKVRMWRFPADVNVEGVYLPYALSAQ